MCLATRLALPLQEKTTVHEPRPKPPLRKTGTHTTAAKTNHVLLLQGRRRQRLLSSRQWDDKTTNDYDYGYDILSFYFDLSSSLPFDTAIVWTRFGTTTTSTEFVVLVKVASRGER